MKGATSGTVSKGLRINGTEKMSVANLKNDYLII